MRALVFGYFGASNLGDEAILHAFKKWFRKRFPDVGIVAISSNPELTKKTHHIDAALRDDLKGVYRAMRDCDVVVCPGGGVFQDSTSSKSVMYYTIVAAMARIRRKPLFLLSQGVGPLKSGVSKRLTRCVFKTATFVSVRDADSLASLRSIGVNRNDILASVDAVLGLEQEPCFVAGRNGDEIVIGVALRPHATLSGAMNSILQAIEGVAPDNHKRVRVRMIPFQIPDDRKVSADFAAKCEKIKNVEVEIFEHDGSDVGVMNVAYHGLDAMIGMRLHSLVLASLYDVPFLGIAYDPKVKAFAENCGMPVMDAETIGGDFIDAQLGSLIRRPESSLDAMRKRIADAAKLLEDNRNRASRVMKSLTEQKRFLLGVPISVRTFEETIGEILRAVAERRKLHVVTVNPEMIFLTLGDRLFRRILNSEAMNTADGIGARLGIRAKYGDRIEKVTGVGIAERLLEISAESGGPKLFLIGSKPEVMEECAKRLATKRPAPNVVGTHHGYLKLVSNADLIREINAAEPDVVLVGMGAPLQEMWIEENRDRINAPVFIGVGGTFDVIAEAVKRAPESYQRFGLEWLYRLIQQPERIRRQLAPLPSFVIIALFESVAYRLKMIRK